MLQRLARRSQPHQRALHPFALGAEVFARLLRLNGAYVEQHHIATMHHLAESPMVLHPLPMRHVGGTTVRILQRTVAHCRPAPATVVMFRWFQAPQFQALLVAGCFLQVSVQVSNQHTGCPLLLHGCRIHMVRRPTMPGEIDPSVRADACRITIPGADHRTLRRISCLQSLQHAYQRVQVYLMMGILTSTKVGMMCKDVANVSTTAGGWVEIVALVEDLQRVQHMETHSGVAA